MIRPADGNETSVVGASTETTDKPTVLVLSRQALKTLPVSVDTAFAGVEGGYVVSAAQKIPDGLLIMTGSEVNLWRPKPVSKA